MDGGAPPTKALILYQLAGGQFPQFQQQPSPSMEVGITDMTRAGAPLEPPMSLVWCPLLWEGQAMSTGSGWGLLWAHSPYQDEGATSLFIPDLRTALPIRESNHPNMQTQNQETGL